MSEERGRGRPSKWKPEFSEQARKLAHLGATDQDIADFFDVDIRTLTRWKLNKDGLLSSLKAGKEEADARVERSLYQRALGYEQDAVKIFMPAGAEAPVYAPYRERINPDVTACIFWLKNRRPDEWRDTKVIDQETKLTATVAELPEGVDEREAARVYQATVGK